jgi:uncharacterized protein (TIGR03118 family)
MIRPPTRPAGRSGRRRARTLGLLGTAAGLGSLALLAGTVPASAAESTAGGSAALHSRYVQTNLVSDQPGVAQQMDPNLVNAWGLSAGPATPLWVSDNGKDVTTLYRGAVGGAPVSIVPLVVSVPGGAPTGQVFNPTTGFVLPDGSPALFLFASENGVISGWNPALGTSAVQVGAASHAVYKGLALEQVHGTQRLLAANFHSGRIDVYTSSFHRISLGAHRFQDPSLPDRYAPFNVAVVGNRVLVAYAKQDSHRHDDVAGAGHGFIDEYTLNGVLIRSLARRGVLDSPWGMTVAPTGFGKFSGDLLVGNFGDGRIHAFDLRTSRLVGVLRGSDGKPLAIDGLWGLLPGNGVNADTDAVWFSAGPAGESHGLLGTLTSS